MRAGVLVGIAVGAACVVLSAAAVAPGAAGVAPGLPPGTADASPPSRAEPSRYSLAGGCYAVRSESLGRFVARDGDGYRASATRPEAAESFRMQATTLGRYLLYESSERFIAVARSVSSAGEPGNATDLTVDEAGEPGEARGAFTIANRFTDRQLAVAGDGALESVAAGEAGEAGHFTFHPAQGCASYPEVEVNVTGEPFTGSPRFGEVSGFAEAHMHQMAFEFLGGEAHCGRPWHRFGAPHALVDCLDHELTEGCGAVLENVLYGDPARCHDPVGWPTFEDWPDHRSLTHEQSYWKWVERAWRGGLRLYVNLMVENRVLCEAYPYNRNPCDEMESVLLQIKRIRQLEQYIDAQYGGPGQGWFRIVTDPYEARRAINQGKLAVVMGMEVSEPFGCRRWLGNATCTAAEIDDWLDLLHDLGIRQLELTNKFDNGLTGVAGDPGEVGTAVNAGNFLSTGRFWDLEHCDTEENHDHTPTGANVPHNHDLIIAIGLDALIGETLPPLGGAAPVYPAPPHCNRLGLTELGEHALRGIVERGMIFDPDHMSVRARSQALDVLEREGYPGVISSHSWSTPNALPRIYGLGGFVAPSASSPQSFASKWRRLREEFSGDQYFGVGYGADSNGFAVQPGPRGPDIDDPVSYPFTSFDGTATLDRQVSGERTFDVNVDGVAHYGLYPDWIEDLRNAIGEEIVEDLGRGAEAYLQMWERADGIGPVRCRGWGRLELRRNGLRRTVRIGDPPTRALRRAGQPADRGRTWRWCAGGSREPSGRGVTAGFARGPRVGIVASTLRRHRVGGIRPGAPARRVRNRADRLRGGIWVRRAGPRRAFVYRVRGGRVRQVGVATRAVARRPALLRRHLDAY